MTSDNSNSNSTLDSNTNVVPSVSTNGFEQIEAAAVNLANKLQSGFALNEENYEFLLNNFSMRVSHKKGLSQEEKDWLIDTLSPLYSEQEVLTVAQLEKTVASKTELQNIDNLKTLITQKKELYDSLEQSVAENQTSLIEEEKLIDFLERTQTSALEALQTQVDSYTPSELLTVIYDVNEKVGENNVQEKIENNKNLYFASGGLFGGLSKLKSSLFGSNIVFVQELQHLVKQYTTPNTLVADLAELKNYMLQTEVFDTEAKDAEQKLAQKTQEIEELIASIKGSQTKMGSLEKEIRTNQTSLEKLAPQAQKLSFKDTAEYLKENFSSFLKEPFAQDPMFKRILLNTYGPNYESELPHLMTTYEFVKTGLASNLDVLENMIQLNQAQKKQFDFSLKRVQTGAEKEQLHTLLSAQQSQVLEQLQRAQIQVNSFFEAAFDSDISDYLDGSLAAHNELALVESSLKESLPLFEKLQNMAPETISRNKLG